MFLLRQVFNDAQHCTAPQRVLVWLTSTGADDLLFLQNSELISCLLTDKLYYDTTVVHTGHDWFVSGIGTQHK